MAKQDVLNLISDFCLGLPVDAEVGRFYDEIVRELGFEECLVGTDIQAIVAEEPQHENQADTIRTLEFHTGHYGRLDRIDSQSLEACIWPQWRAGVSNPTAVTHSHEDEDSFRLVPVPDSPDTLTTIRTEYREDVLVYLELPIAFEIMHREFHRESDHQDVEFAATAGIIAAVLWRLLGLEMLSASSLRADTNAS